MALPFRVREITEINDNLEAGALPVTLSQALRDTPADESNLPQPQVSSTSRKRSIEAEQTTELPKKIKKEPQDMLETASTTTESQDKPSSSDASKSEVQIKPDPDSTNQLPSTSSSSSNVKQEPDSSDVKNEPVSTQNTRPSCEHGIRCFRHNPEHRSAQAHPGDNDYRRPEFPPAPAGAPRCPYWSACYRRNPDHFRMFEHPPSCEFSFFNFINLIFKFSLKAATYDPNAQPPPRPAAQVQQPRRPAINLVFYNDNFDNDDDEDEDEDMFGDFDDTDVDADYEINGDSASDEDENNLEE